jgi:hypothetical protein
MKRITVKKIVCAVTAAFVLAGAMPFGTGLRISGSSGDSLTASAAEDYHSWRQNDPRWAEIPMGTYNAASVGCLATSLSMIAVMSGVRDESSFNPGVFISSMNSIGAFNQWGGISSWGSIYQIIPEFSDLADISFTGETEAEKAQEVREWMDKGYYVIVNCNTHHWVVAENVENDRIYMIDPACDDRDMFEVYGNAANEYMLVRSTGIPFEGVIAPAPAAPAAAVLAAEPAFTQPVYEPAICIDIEGLPYRTEYSAGEELDLEGGFAQVSFVDPDKGTVNLPGEYMNGRTYSYSVDTSDVDMSVPGVYTVKLIAFTDLARTEESFSITVSEAKTAPAVTTVKQVITKASSTEGVTTSASKASARPAATTASSAPAKTTAVSSTTVTAAPMTTKLTKGAATTAPAAVRTTKAAAATAAVKTEAATAAKTEAATKAPEKGKTASEPAQTADAPADAEGTGSGSETAEYYYDGSGIINVLSEPGTPEAVTVAEVSGGCVVTVTKTSGNYGYVESEGFSGWIDISGLTAAGGSASHTAGDINNDGQVDIYDLTLLNEHLNSCGALPKGFSMLRADELEAADINGDGAVGQEDVLLYLMIICA